jgi:hypothetical protein
MADYSRTSTTENGQVKHCQYVHIERVQPPQPILPFASYAVDGYLRVL